MSEPTTVRTSEKAAVIRQPSSDAWQDCIVAPNEVADLVRVVTVLRPVPAERRLASTPASLTTASAPHDNEKAWYRDKRVNSKPNRQDGYDRIRPQGRRGFRALQSLGGK